MPSIGILEHYQKPTDKPTRRIKKSGGQSLVRQGLAIWLIENVLLRMLATRARSNPMGHTLKSTPNCGRATYIPDKLPANIDAQLGVLVQIPALPGQIRFRHF